MSFYQIGITDIDFSQSDNAPFRKILNYAQCDRSALI